MTDPCTRDVQLPVGVFSDGEAAGERLSFLVHQAHAHHVPLPALGLVRGQSRHGAAAMSKSLLNLGQPPCVRAAPWSQFSKRHALDDLDQAAVGRV